MSLFEPDQRNKTQKHKRIYAAFELAYTLVDFSAAVCFIIGSVMFFYEAWQTPGTWLFVIGSILFAVKPTLRLAREVKYLSMGDVDDLADRLK